MDRLTIYLRQILDKLLSSDKNAFSKIAVKREVMTNIQDFANQKYPKEFVAVLDGKTKDGTLLISGMLFQPFDSTDRMAIMRDSLPMTSGAIGSVHSHPSPNNSPSKEDLSFFNRKGVVHFIAGYPFREKDVACYDLNGNKLDFEIID